MNVFSALDLSDNEDEVVQPKKATKPSATDKSKPVEAKGADASKNGKASNSKDAKAKETTAAPAARAEATVNASSTKAEGDVHKENNRGGRQRGKEHTRHGEKRHDRGAAQSDAAANSGKREFERRSGTGRGREVSRGGRGPYGAGNVDQEALEAEKDPDAAIADATADAEGAEEEVADAPAAEPEVKVLSLDDFLRQKQESRASSKLLAAQNTGRSVQTNGLSAPLAGKVNEETASDAQAKAKKDQRSTGKTQIEVSFKFDNPAPASRPRFGEGDRESRRPDSRGGRASSRGGRGEGRGDSRRSAAPSVSMSTADFPALN
jgi:hypothetical protein